MNDAMMAASWKNHTNVLYTMNSAVSAAVIAAALRSFT